MFFSVRVNMGERSELFWLRAITSLAEVLASLSVSEAEQALRLVTIYQWANDRALTTKPETTKPEQNDDESFVL